MSKPPINFAHPMGVLFGFRNCSPIRSYDYIHFCILGVAHQAHRTSWAQQLPDYSGTLTVRKTTKFVTTTYRHGTTALTVHVGKWCVAHAVDVDVNMCAQYFESSNNPDMYMYLYCIFKNRHRNRHRRVGILRSQDYLIPL